MGLIEKLHATASKLRNIRKAAITNGLDSIPHVGDTVTRIDIEVVMDGREPLAVLHFGDKTLSAHLSPNQLTEEQVERIERAVNGTR